MADEVTPAAEAEGDNSEGAGEPLEGTTPEEVAKIMNLPSKPEAVADEEEGDDPDAPVDKTDEDNGEEESEESEESDELEEEEVESPAKPVVAEPSASDDDKYSLTVEDANGVSFKIPVGAKMEDIMAEFEPKNNGQILDILNQLQKLEAQKSADEQTTEAESAKAAQAQKVSDIRAGWEAESKDLQASKRIPAGDDGDKRIADVYKFMNEQNDTRIKAGKPTLNSFEDALDKLEATESRDKVVADAKAAKEEARKNGSLVGGSSAPATGPAKAYSAGSARNANEAIRNMGLV